MIWFQRAVVLVIVAILGWLLPTLFFDDAYISFRFAANIASGHGFTYNPPDRVLGTTTPLYTLMLAAAAWLGADIEAAAWLLGVACHALMCLMVLEVMRRLMPEEGPRAFPLPLVAAVLCAAQPHLALTAMGGMETPLYVALLLAVMLAATAGAPGWTGALAGLALLARPDAALIFIPAAWLLWRAGDALRRLMRAAVWCAAVAGPWLIFATVYFGSPVPHSIAAKRLIHPYGPLQVLLEFGTFLMDDPLLALAIPLALWGVERRRSTRLAVTLGGFCLLYLIAYVFSGVTPFPWYVNPLLPPVLMLALAGLDDLLGRLRLRNGVVWAALAVVIVGIAGGQLKKEIPGLRAAWDAWEGQYEVAGRWIFMDSRPGDKVLVGEVGVIGFLLPERVILDSSGINSPEVYRLRLGRDEADPRWTRDVIQTLDPDYITTSVSYLNIRTLGEEPWFNQTYQRVPLPLLEREGQLVFKRR